MYLQQVFLLRCPCGKPIVLPRQSPLGRDEGQQYRPTDKWPLVFACIDCERSSAHLVRKVQLGDTDEKLAQYLRIRSLWRLEIQCAHESCGERWTIYTIEAKDAPETDVVRAVRRIVPPTHIHPDAQGQPPFPAERYNVSRFVYDF